MSIEKVLETIKKQLQDHEQRISKLEGIEPQKPLIQEKKLSIKEFILTKNPDNFKKKILAIGFYLEKIEGLSSFNVKDLEDGFRSAKEPLPKNINDNVNKLIGKGYLMEDRNKKDNLTAWILTSSGERYAGRNFEES